MIKNISKTVELVLSQIFIDSNEATVKNICNNFKSAIIKLENLSNGNVSYNSTIRILELIAKNRGTISISRQQLIKVAYGISQREWVSTIAIFHIIMAICVITDYNNQQIEDYTNSEIMFRPLLSDYGIQSSIVTNVLNSEIYINKRKVDIIATSLSINNTIVLKGNPEIGKKSLVLALIKKIILGKYPLLYNSSILMDPSKNEINRLLEDANGSHIISIITHPSSETLTNSSDGNNHIPTVSKRSKFIYIVNSKDSPILQAINKGVVNADVIELDPPDDEETSEILKVHVKILQKYIDFDYDDEIIDYIVQSSSRFEQSSSQPTKSIKLLNECIFNKFNSLLTKDQSIEIPSSLDNCSKNEYEEIFKQLKHNTAFQMIKRSSIHIHVTIKDVEDFIINKFKLTKEVLASLLSSNIKEHLKGLKGKILEKIYGQDEIVEQVVNSLWRRAVKIDVMQRPISYLFIGATGVGKTYLAKNLSHFLLGSENYMERFDMSEYSKDHEISKLIGSPPGYVGSNQPGRLTQVITKNPYCVILFDELEKAHPDIMNIFLQILDDGRMTDNHGKVLDFSKTIIIMTSNIGVDQVSKESEERVVGFGRSGSAEISENEKKAKLIKAAEDNFKPEFLNRIGKMATFNDLKDEHFLKIINTRLNEIQQSSILDLNITDGTVDTLLNIGKCGSYNIQKYNAREIKRVITDNIENKIIDFVSEHDIDTPIDIFTDNKKEIKIAKRK